MYRHALLLALALAACSDDRPAPERAPAPAAVPAPTPFDSARVTVDTLGEPPEATVEIPQRPVPPPEPRPRPPSIAPITRGPAGSCDVGGAERYCLTFTGEGWTPESARGRCAEAPDAAFGAGACPVARRIATCTYAPSSAPDREAVYTYYAPYDVALAELACPGTFERFD